MPVEQTMSNDELILRRLNEKPFDLCEECQNDLKLWFARRPCVYLDDTITDMKIMCGATKAERFEADDKRCKSYHVECGKPRCWGTKEKDECDCGGDRRKCTHYPDNREGNDDKRNGDTE